jgi:hypothetical protein
VYRPTVPGLRIAEQPDGVLGRGRWGDGPRPKDLDAIGPKLAAAPRHQEQIHHRDGPEPSGRRCVCCAT